MQNDDNTAEANARLFIHEIRAALARGTKHYNAAGQLLTTELEIIDCLLIEGGITFEPPTDEG